MLRRSAKRCGATSRPDRSATAALAETGVAVVAKGLVRVIRTGDQYPE